MSDYTPPPGAERFAALVHRQQVESERQRRRLAGATTEPLKLIALDPQEPPTARAHALSALLRSRAEGLPEILLALYDDPETDLACLAIQYTDPASDPRLAERLRGLLDDARDRVWSEAACTLARRRDEALLPRILAWYEGGDEPHRNVAIECLVQLDDPEAYRHLVEAWERGGRDEGDRVVLAVALLRRGDERGLPYLEATARRADGAWAVTAATWIQIMRPALGLELMRVILDQGTLDAQRAMVNQIWNFTRSPHAFTADGLHEARAWVEQEERKLGPAPESRAAGSPPRWRSTCGPDSRSSG